jgi:hypothetical protein
MGKDIEYGSKPSSAKELCWQQQPTTKTQHGLRQIQVRRASQEIHRTTPVYAGRLQSHVLQWGVWRLPG